MNILFLKLFIILSLLLSASNTIASCEFNQPQKNVALVIGNTQYEFISALTNPTNDAIAIANVLRDYEYSVIERTDLTLTQMVDVIRCFKETLKPGGVGIFYYAGHGIQMGQYNYLLPIDLEVDELDEKGADQLRSKSVNFNDILMILKQAELATNIIILDACRNNPFKGKSRGLGRSKIKKKLEKMAEQGFSEPSELSAPARSYIAFATGPGKLSSDGYGENGLFTTHLLKYMKNASLDASAIFSKTTADVYKDSRKYQIPWRRTSLFEAFYFSPAHMRSNNDRSIQQNALKPLVKEQPKFVKYLNKAKKLLYERGRPKKALPLLKKALKYAPDNTDILYEIAVANSNLFNHAQAIFVLKKIVKINSDNASAYSLLAHSYEELGDTKRANQFRLKK